MLIGSKLAGTRAWRTLEISTGTGRISAMEGLRGYAVLLVFFVRHDTSFGGICRHQAGPSMFSHSYVPSATSELICFLSSAGMSSPVRSFASWCRTWRLSDAGLC